MCPILGDFLLHFRPFEVEMHVVQRDGVTWEDGYRVVDESYEKPFLGILVDNKEDVAELQGTREMAERLLYVRKSQDWYPELVEKDIVKDEKDDKWKVVIRFDYTTYGNCLVFGVARVEEG